MTGLRRDVASRPALDLFLRAIAIGVVAVLIFIVLPALIASAA
jgi:hypothetical protein